MVRFTKTVFCQPQDIDAKVQDVLKAAQPAKDSLDPVVFLHNIVIAPNPVYTPSVIVTCILEYGY